MTTASTLNHGTSIYPFMSEQTTSGNETTNLITSSANNFWTQGNNVNSINASSLVGSNKFGNPTMEDNFRDLYYSAVATDIHSQPQRYMPYQGDEKVPPHKQQHKLSMQQADSQQPQQQHLQSPPTQLQPQLQNQAALHHQLYDQLIQMPYTSQPPNRYYPLQNQLPQADLYHQSLQNTFQSNLTQILLPLQPHQQQVYQLQFQNSQHMGMPMRQDLMTASASSSVRDDQTVTNRRSLHKCPVSGCSWNLRKLAKKSDLRKHCFENHLEKGKISRDIDPKAAEIISLLSYKCTVPNCGKHYSRSDSLKRHIRLIHNRSTSRFNRKLRQQGMYDQRRDLHSFH